MLFLQVRYNVTVYVSGKTAYTESFIVGYYTNDFFLNTLNFSFFISKLAVLIPTLKGEF